MLPLSSGHQGLLNDSHDFPQLDCVLFDLEATLFWSESFRTTMLRAALDCVSARLGLSPSHAELELNSKRAQLAMTLGYTPALSTTILALGVDVYDWVTRQNTIQVDEVVVKDSCVIALLRSLAQHYTLLVYTNMSTGLALRVLARLGIGSLFADVFGLQDFATAKPNPRAISSLVDRGVITPSRCVAVGDRYHLDIAPVLAIGGHGYLIQSTGSLGTFCQSALRAKGVDTNATRCT